MSTVRKFQVAGPPAAMGEAFGEQFRDETRQLTERRIAHLIEFVADHAPGRRLSRRQAVALAGRTLQAHRAYDADVWAEFEGIARGAALPVEELLIGNGYTDVRDYALAQTGGPAAAPQTPGECTAFLVPGQLADGGAPIVGQTWDMDPDARAFLVLVRRRPAGAPETLGLTTAGCLCLIGMNGEGVAVGNTNLVASDARPGVNYLFTITRALRCGSAAAAAEAIEAAPRLSGHNYYAAGGASAINVEASAARHERTEVSGGVFVHANHFRSASLRALEMNGGLANSRWRQRRLEQDFAALSPPISAEAAWAQLADDTRGEGAVCNEDYAGRFGKAATLATVVQCPARGQLHLCEGGARLGTREVLRL